MGRSGIPASERDYEAASEAEWDAFMAICSYRCHTPEEARRRADYLLTTSTVKDTWDENAKALLELFRGEIGHDLRRAPMADAIAPSAC